MKKFIFMLISMFVMSVGIMNAQSQVCQSISDGWFGGVNLGVNAPIKHSFGFAENSWDSEWRFTFGGEIGRNITPVTSLSLSDELFVNIPFSTPHFKTAFDKNTMYANVGFNLTNFLLGYNGTPRSFEVRVIPGIGWAHYFEEINLNGTTNHKNYVTYRIMTSLDWNFGKNKEWQFNFKPALTYYDRFHTSTCDVEIRIGTTYKFKGYHTKSHNIVLSDKTRTEAEYINLLDENNTLKNTPNKVIERVTEKTIVQTVTIPNQVNAYFEKGSAELTDEAKTALDGIPNGSKVSVDGYASADGSKSFNQTLSEQRAATVADYLKNKGIEVISANGNGVANPNINRVTVVTTVQ